MMKTTTIAVVAMWFLGSLGVWIFAQNQEWFFLMAPDMPDNLHVLQVLGLYTALCGVKIPGAAAAGGVMATNPAATTLRTAWVVFGFQGVLLLLRGFGSSGSEIVGDSRMTFVLELVSAVLLTGFAVMIHWAVKNLIKVNWRGGCEG